MTIREIRLHHLRAQLPEPLGNALTFFDKKETLLVELVSGDGLSGWGETWAMPEAAAAVIRAKLARHVLGQDPAATGRLHQAMTATAGYDRRGVTMMATAAIDIALHDLAAKARGISVAALLGGAVRDRVLAYASGPYLKPGGHPYRTFQTEVEAYQKAGFRAVKLRSGYSPHEDAAIAIALREQLGPDAALMADFNQGYTAPAAIDAARRMEPAGMLWLEEPVQPEDLPGYRSVVRHAPQAIAGGEGWTSLAAFREAFAQECLHIVQPDIALCAGFTGVQRVAALAMAYQCPVMPHVWGSAVNFHAALQMCAVLPAYRGGGPLPFPFFEFDMGPNPLFAMHGVPGVNADGTISIPDGPGLGVTLAPEQFAPYVVESWTVAA